MMMLVSQNQTRTNALLSHRVSLAIKVNVHVLHAHIAHCFDMMGSVCRRLTTPSPPQQRHCLKLLKGQVFLFHVFFMCSAILPKVTLFSVPTVISVGTVVSVPNYRENARLCTHGPAGAVEWHYPTTCPGPPPAPCVKREHIPRHPRTTSVTFVHKGECSH